MDKLTELQKLVESAQGHGDSLYNKNVKKYATELRKDLQAVIVLCREQRKAVLEFQKAMPPKVKKAGEAKDDDDDAIDVADDADDADDGDDEPVVEVKEVKSTKGKGGKTKEAEKAPEPAKETKQQKAPPKKK